MTTSDQERAAPAQQPVACPVLSEELVEQAWLSLLNVDDRTSPEEYPDMALIRFDELREIIASFVTASEPELKAEIVHLQETLDTEIKASRAAWSRVEALSAEVGTARAAAFEEAAQIAEEDSRSELAKKSGYVPYWLHYARNRAAAIRSRAALDKGATR